MQPSHVKQGNIFILQHSTFANVVRFGCSELDAEQYAKNLTSKTRIPGEFTVYSSLFCHEPCFVKDRVVNSLKNSHYVSEFYEVSPEKALAVVRREVMRIPALML